MLDEKVRIRVADILLHRVFEPDVGVASLFSDEI